MPKALIIGSKGQDGSYLSELLESKSYELIGVTRQGVEDPLSNKYPAFSLNRESLKALLHAERPDELYYLAAVHNSSEDSPIDDLELLHASFETNVAGLAEVLSSIGRCSPKTRLFYAASSHVFGEPDSPRQNESTPFNPVNVYGISKTAGVHICRYFREQHNLHVSVGILYNHESPRRSARFLSRKVTHGAVMIKRGRQEKLAVGSLESLVDWGFAADYVRAMWDILQLKDPDDFIIATGVLHSVRDFVETAFQIVGLDWSKHITERKNLLTKNSVTLCGDYSKLQSVTHWRPETSFEKLIGIMIQAELNIAG